MKFYTVDVKNISCDTPRDNFSVVDLENLADLIIESGGLTRPLIVKNIGLESFAVIDGHFEYYAALRAREKNPRQCEMVNAFVIASKNEEIISKQIDIFKKNNLRKSKNIEPSSEKDEIILLTQQINDLTGKLAQEKQEKQTIYENIKTIEGKFKKRMKPVDTFNDFSLLDLTQKLRDAKFTDNKKVSKIVESIDKERNKKTFESLNDIIERVKIQNGKTQQKAITSKKMIVILDTWLSIDIKILDVFNEFSLIDLILRLKIGGGFNENKASQIAETIDKERKKKKFDSLNDVVERVRITSGKRQIKGITSDKMVTILDTWSRILFV